MADLNDFRKMAMEAASAIAEKTKDVAKTAADMTKVASKITKLKAEIAGERDSIRKNYAELGAQFYETHKDNPPEGFELIFSEITVSYGAIQGKEAEIEALANSEESGKDIIDNVTIKVGDAYDAVKDKVSDAYDAVKDKLDNMDVETLEEVSEETEEVPEETDEEVTEAEEEKTEE